MADPRGGSQVRVPIELSIPKLLSGAGFRVESTPPASRRLHLFDTGDRRLAAAGAELSFNVHDGWCWHRGTLGHPKLPAREWSAAPATPDSVVREWSRAYRRGRPLAARAAVTVQRRGHHVTDAQSEQLLTLAEERVDEQVAGRWRPRIRRLSVLAHGEGTAALAALRAIEEVALADEPTLILLRPALVRAPRLSLPPAGSTGARALFLRSATLSVVQWLYFDCELSGGASPEALRKLRVALRRLRSDLQAFASLLDGEWAATLRARLGELAAHLGVVRDAEVLTARLSGLISALPAADQGGSLPLLDIAGGQLASARTELLEILARDDYLGVVEAAVGAVTDPRWSDADDTSPVTRLARRPWRRLHDQVAALGDSPDDSELHRVRILAKRARYAADACVPAAGEPAAKCAERLAGLQTVLGDHHDALVTREWLRREAIASATLAFAAGELAALELARLAAARERWRDAWVAASRKQDWRWLRS